MKNNVNVIPVKQNKGLLYKDIEMMIEESLEYNLISVEAGSGYGKTRLFREYFAQAGKKYIWLKLNDLDNVPEQFWLRILSVMLKWDRYMFEQLKTIRFPDSPEEIREIMNLVSKRLSGSVIYIVLDDFQVINEPKILWLIERLALLKMKEIKLILLSRRKPKLNFHLLEKGRSVKRLKETDLSFRLEELKAFLADNGILSADRINERLFLYTKGWRLAVDLIVSSMKNGNKFDDVEEDVMPDISQVMERDIFAAYPGFVKSGLVKLSILEVFPLPLVMKLTEFGYEEISLILRDNPFINYDAQGDLLEIHHLFLEFLRKRLGYVDKQEREAIKQKAANWLIKKDYGEAALKCYMFNREYQEVLRLAGQYISYGGSNESMAGISSVLDAIPQEVKHHFPEIHFYKAFLHFRFMELSLAEKELRKLRMVLLKKEEDKELMGESYILEGMLHLYRREEDFGNYFKMAFRLIPTGSRMKYRMAPLLDKGMGFFARSMSSQEIDRMMQAYRSGLPCMIRMTGGCGAGLQDYVLAQLAYYEGHFIEAERYTWRVLKQAEEMEQKDMSMAAYLLLIKIAIAGGKGQQAQAIWKNHIEGQEIDTNAARIQLAKGNLSQIYNDAMLKVFMLYYQGKYEQALTYINSIGNRDDMGIFARIYQMLLKSLCCFAAGAEQEGFEAFWLAYQLAGNGRYKVFFFELGRVMKRTIDKIRSREDCQIPEDWLEQIGQRAETYGKQLRDLRKDYFRMNNIEQRISLSEEEQRILEGWCQGIPRQEIARLNSISESLVKSKQKKIYQKLEGMTVSDAVHIYTLLKINKHK